MSTAVRAAPALAQAHPSPAGGRVAYIDRLKVLLVAGIIAAHGVFGYSELEGTWPYQDVQEVHLAEVTGIVLGTLVLPVVLFVMGLSSSSPACSRRVRPPGRARGASRATG